VTHDRYFLERTCSTILELDDSAIYRHQGTYASFLEVPRDHI
jgi:ATP-binding cassette subfamily F protein uup